MKLKTHTFLKPITAMVLAGTLAVSCNKDLPVAVPIVPSASGPSLLTSIRADQTNFSILDSAIKKAGAGTLALLSDSTAGYTFFAPTNAAFATIGITNVTALAAFSSAQLQSILSYHLVPGIKLADSINTFSAPVIRDVFPNIQLPTAMVLAAPSATLPPGLRNSVFPSRRGANAWVNNIPIVGAPTTLGNSVVYKVASVLLPPSTTVKGILASDTSFTILRAAITRADSGQVAGPTTMLDSLTNYAPANITLFAPTNNAFRAMFPPGTPDANIIGALNTPSFFTAQTVRGLIAYHLMTVRAFSVNFPATPSPFPTLLAVPPTNTIVPVIVSNSGTTFMVKGLANATFSNVISRDRLAINGIVHVIDQVLKPQ